ncbi:MAG: hypothetical protein ACFCUS_10530 [Rubrimonas sp.]|uniref:hypothetical protein n=1 Tax=Rubrimonas sp. TaxID=2036015 RepID=UPI002FDD1D5A
MELISDALLIAGAVGAAAYCRLLARRLGALKELDSGLGAAIAALSRQVDELRASLEAAKSVSGEKAREIGQLTARAEMAAGRLELLLASLHEGGSRRPIDPRPDRAAARAAGLAAAAREDAAARLAEIERPEDPPAPSRPREAPPAEADMRAALRWAAEQRAAGGRTHDEELRR